MLKKTKPFILANNVFNNFQVLKPHKKRKLDMTNTRSINKNTHYLLSGIRLYDFLKTH